MLQRAVERLAVGTQWQTAASHTLLMFTGVAAGFANDLDASCKDFVIITKSHYVLTMSLFTSLLLSRIYSDFRYMASWPCTVLGSVSLPALADGLLSPCFLQKELNSSK